MSDNYNSDVERIGSETISSEFTVYDLNQLCLVDNIEQFRPIKFFMGWFSTNYRLVN